MTKANDNCKNCGHSDSTFFIFLLNKHLKKYIIVRKKMNVFGLV